MQKAIGDLIKEEYSFFIPYYQRGYRWGKTQVYALLNDLLEFHRKIKARNSDYQYYSLQPLVVKKDDKNRNYRLIDGQQRLTTIYLILSAFEAFAETRNKKKFDLSYDREESKEFLNKIIDNKFRESKYEKNIDFYFISNAYENIFQWIEDNNYDEDYIESFMNFIRQGSEFEEYKDTNENIHFRDINQNIRFIWYELPEHEDEFDTFIRLNIGKIPLTNAELIKSFIIQKIKATEKRFEISKEWDDIEYSLNNNEFFGFLTKDKLNTRIELLFKILLNKKVYKEFELYDNFVETYEKEDIEEIWKKIKEIFYTLLFWFENREFYHLVGYLIAIDENIIDIWQKYIEHKGKNSFQESLIKIIKLKLKISIIDKKVSLKEKNEPILLKHLYYKHPDTLKVLLLFNILTLIKSSKESYIKFSFDLYNQERWSIEHINPQTDKLEILMGNEKFIKELEELKYQNINETLKKFKESSTDKQKKERWKKLENIFSDNRLRENNDNIRNLTLLSSKINSHLQNNFFPIKRKMIIDKDSNGEFIPIATKNLFLKYYSDFSKEECDMIKWKYSDGTNYIKEINNIIVEFFEGGE